MVNSLNSHFGFGLSHKKSSGRSTSSPLIARCAEEVNDIVLGANLLHNHNIINTCQVIFLSPLINLVFDLHPWFVQRFRFTIFDRPAKLFH